MKVYPLIYSRTKNFDFVPDFLARPKDLDCQLALKYVKNAMTNLDFVQDIRYTVFPAGKYCICGGISCISSKLVKKLKTMNSGFTSDYPDAEEYLKDCEGRPLACFVGIAIPKSETSVGKIPDISLDKYWQVYLEYLKHQWFENRGTSSEQLDFPPIDDIKEKIYTEKASSAIQTESFGSHNVIRNYADCRQQTLDYFFDAVLRGKDDSFITEIQNMEEWNALYFKTAAVSESLYSALKANPVNISGAGGRLLGTHASRKNDSGEIKIKKARMPEHMPDTDQKKTPAAGIMPVIIGAAVLVFLIVILFIIRKKII